ncbi:hypothetical protein RGQ29_002720 [Quercus rubra]|uniref:Gag1-like clamp domain-containing protein n=1 Tax=Quercus rubra TaxID=3512 RepID=A0AAN7E9M6_QUERU|nr:hypothetical protein RGQ29_002720 [Quercus rubra]
MLGDTAIVIHPDDPRYNHLHGKYAIHPFNGRKLPIVCDATLVDPKFGSVEIAWHEKRREWVGDQSQRSRRTPREPIMSWTTTYEDLLLSTEPFQQPIPLAEMVDFLVDIWNEEGLYD